MRDSNRRTLRTVFQLVLDAAVVLPVVVATMDVDEATTVGAALAALAGVGAAVTRVMNTAAVERFLKRWAPWLAADPNRDEV